MSRESGQIGRFLPPLLAVGALVAVMVAGGMRPRKTPGEEAYHARVAAAIDTIPIQVGTWFGRDVPPPEVAVEMLKPNRVLQRRYVDAASGRSISLLVVHCRDVRDMQGHYPPRCYPANGWEAGSHERTGISFLGDRVDAITYEFVRFVNGVKQPLEVLNFFIIPGRPLTVVPGMDALMQAEATRNLPRLGAAQIQILGLDGIPAEERAGVLARFLDVLGPVADAIAGEV